MFEGLNRSISCCRALNQSGFLRNNTSPYSDAGLRLRDLASTGEPCNLLMYWGVWKREEVNDHDLQLLRMLDSIRQLIADALAVPTFIQIIFTDTHAQINGVSESLTKSYAANVSRDLPDGCRLTLMSEIAGYGRAHAPIVVEPENFGPKMTRIRGILLAQAEKLFGPEDAAARADTYMSANLREAATVFARWPMALFFHIGPAELRPIFPSLPMLYGYAGGARITRKPWFR